MVHLSHWAMEKWLESGRLWRLAARRSSSVLMESITAICRRVLTTHQRLHSDQRNLRNYWVGKKNTLHSQNRLQPCSSTSDLVTNCWEPSPKSLSVFIGIQLRAALSAASRHWHYAVCGDRSGGEKTSYQASSLPLQTRSPRGDAATCGAGVIVCFAADLAKCEGH